MDRLEKAILWRKTGIDSYGAPVFGSPEDINVTVDNSTSEMLDAKGNKVALDATVVIGPETGDLKIGDLLWIAPDSSYSALEQYMGTGSGLADQDTDANLYQVKMFDGASDLKNRVTRREAGLVRFRSTPSAS